MREQRLTGPFAGFFGKPGHEQQVVVSTDGYQQQKRQNRYRPSDLMSQSTLEHHYSQAEGGQIVHHDGRQSSGIDRITEFDPPRPLSYRAMSTPLISPPPEGYSPDGSRPGRPRCREPKQESA